MKFAKLLHKNPIRIAQMILVLTSLVFTSVAQATDFGHKIKQQPVYRGPLRGSAPTDLPLWYNGDWNGESLLYFNGLIFSCEEEQSASSLYDDFIISSPNGWKVTSVFTNQFFDTTDCIGHLLDVAGATWEIRQGVSDGNAGTLVASGFSYSPTVTDLGVSGGGCAEEYQILITGLNVSLAPGTYWLNVTPIGEGGDEGPVTTSGTNCVGSPCGNDQNSFSEYDNWAALGADFSMGVNGISCPGNCFLILIRATSIKIAQSGQIEPIVLPLTGQTGVEDRSSVPRGNYTIQMTFTQNITSTGRVTASCGRVASTSINGGTLTVNLSGVGCNAADITVTVNDVKDDAGQNLGAASATMGILVGDVDGNRIVDQNDLTIIRSELGQSVNDTNFRSDVNGDGQIDEADIQLATRQLGTMLPP